MRVPLIARPLALLALLVLPCALLGTARPLRADDVAPAATPSDVRALVQMVAAYEAADRANDVDLRVSLLPGLCRTAADTTWPESDAESRRAVLAARARVRTACYRAITHPRKVLVLAGLDGYAILAVPGSSQDLKPLARRSANKRRPLEVRLAAIAAWGAVHDPGTHGELLEYVRLPSPDAEARTLAISALQALQGYRALERGVQRHDLMAAVMGLFSRLREESRLSSMGAASPLSRDWYEVVEKAFVELVNALGGQIFVSYGQCARWWADNKASIRAGRVWAKPAAGPSSGRTPDNTPR